MIIAVEEGEAWSWLAHMDRYIDSSEEKNVLRKTSLRKSMNNCFKGICRELLL